MKRMYKIAVFVALFLVLFSGLVIYISVVTNGVLRNINFTNQTITGPVHISAAIASNSILDYNNARALMAYSLVSYSSSNATNATVYLEVYEKAPFQRVYLINVTGFCSSCFDGNSVRNSLEAELRSYDLIRNSSSFNYIPLSALASVPGNSTIIVPSGLIPASLLNDVNASIFRLLEKGDVVIYVGLNFSKSLGPNGLVFVSSPEVIARISANSLDTIPISSFRQINTSANRTHFAFSTPSFAFSKGSVVVSQQATTALLSLFFLCLLYLFSLLSYRPEISIKK